MLNQTNTQYDSFDVPAVEPHPAIQQAQNFLKSNGKITSYFYTISKTLGEAVGMNKDQKKDALLLLDAAELRLIGVVSDLEKASALARKKNSKAVKPVDLYRRYSDTLRAIMKRNGAYARDAQDQLTSLYLEQAQSDNELENPFYINSYTGEKEPEEIDERKVEISVPELKQLPVMSQIQTDLGWNDEIFDAFVKAQIGGYDEEEEEELPEEDRGYVPPTLTPDFIILSWLQAESWKAIGAFNAEKSVVTSKMKKNVASFRTAMNTCYAVVTNPASSSELVDITYKMISSYKDEAMAYRNNWNEEFMKLFRPSLAFREMIECIRQIAGQDLVTGAAVYVKVAGDYGLNHEDIQHISVRSDAYSTLVEFLDMYEDDIEELLHDSPTTLMSESNARPLIDLLEKGTFGFETVDENGTEHVEGAMEHIMPRLDADPSRTASWNIGYTKAIIDGATLDEATDAGWVAWRKTMSPEGETAYNAELKVTSNRAKAMKIFWSVCPKEVPRPLDKITGILPNGVTLRSGRTISWTVACMKVRGNELDLPKPTKIRLADTLAGLKYGPQLVALLRS